jgi:hypothetical protein
MEINEVQLQTTNVKIDAASQVQLLRLIPFNQNIPVFKQGCFCAK